TAVLPDGSTPRWSRETVAFDFDDDIIAGAKGEELTRALIAKGNDPGCTPVGRSSFGGDEFARAVAVGGGRRVLGPLPGTLPADMRRQVDAEARPVWKELTALPRNEQISRITAMRTAAHSCEGEAFDVLSGGASR